MSITRRDTASQAMQRILADRIPLNATNPKFAECSAQASESVASESKLHSESRLANAITRRQLGTLSASWASLLLLLGSGLMVGCDSQSGPNGTANSGGNAANAANSATNNKDASPATTGTIVVTNLPLRQFASAIAGDKVKVVLPVPSEEDPAFWQPSDDNVATMQAADVICLNGATYESWLPTVTLPESRLVETSKSFQDKWIQMAEGLTHSHGPAGEHTHTGVVGTTWIDFDQARQQAAAILAAMNKRWPDQKENFAANYAKLEAQIQAIDKEMQQVAAKMRDVPIVVSHPIYDYWLRRYELKGKSVHWEASEIPTAENIEELKKVLADHPAKYMIWEGDPASEAVKVLDEMGLQSVVFTPAGNGTADDNWFSIMQENIERLKKIFP